MNAELAGNWHERGVACAERWNLSRLQWSPDVSTARICFCDSLYGPAVLKVSVEPGMVAHEARALAHFGGEICPVVCELAEDLDAVLLERYEVQDDLSAWYPDAEREINIWLPFFHAVAGNHTIPEGFPTLAKFAEVFDRILARPLSPHVARLMSHARNRREILMGSPSENRLLHGDMHHFNLLRDTGDAWHLIDPHGVIGHPLYELGAFLRNPWGACYAEPGVQKRLEERVEILAERLALSRQVVAEYGFYGAAFSVAWSLEEDEDPDVEGMVRMAGACLSIASPDMGI